MEDLDRESSRLQLVQYKRTDLGRASLGTPMGTGTGPWVPSA